MTFLYEVRATMRDGSVIDLGKHTRAQIHPSLREHELRWAVQSHGGAIYYVAWVGHAIRGVGVKTGRGWYASFVAVKRG